MNAHCAFRHVRDGGAAKVERRLERLRAFQVLQPHEDRQLCQGVARNRRTRGQRHRRSQRRLGAGRLVRGPGRHRLRRSHDRALRARFRRTAADQVQSMPKGGLFRIGSSVMGDPGALIELGQRFAPTHHCRYPEPWPHPWALYLPRALCSKQLDVATRVTRVFGFVVGAVSNVFNDRHLLVT